MAVDRKQLPRDRHQLQSLVIELSQKVDTLEALLHQVLEVKQGRKSETLSREQLTLFEAAAAAGQQPAAEEEIPDIDDDPDLRTPPASSSAPQPLRGRKLLPKHLKRERIEYDLPADKKFCNACRKPLRRFGEDSSERLEFVPAQLKVIEDVCFKYACACTIHTAQKPEQPLPKSLAGASLLAQVIVSKFCDHQPLHRQAKMFARHGLELNEQTMGDWMRDCATLLGGLYGELKRHVLASKVVGTDDTSVKVRVSGLDRTLSGRLWPYHGDRQHIGVVYDFTMDRSRAGPVNFLREFRGHLQADAYAVYDEFFKKQERGLIEVGCVAHARRHIFHALASDTRLQPVLHWIAKLYAVEQRARLCGVVGEALTRLRQRYSEPVLRRLRALLDRLHSELLPKSAAGKAVNYFLRHWNALTRFVQDGDLPIDNNHTERSIRPWAVGRRNWTFFGSKRGGETASVLASFVATCKLVKVDPFVWFHDVLKRIADHPQPRIADLLPHNWTPLQST